MASDNGTTFTVTPIGETSVKKNRASIVLRDPYREGLRELDRFTHVVALRWAHKTPDEGLSERVVFRLPYAPEVTAGVFATRSQFRPNSINQTVCEIREIDVERGEIVVNNIDAYDGTPVIDLKPYYPVFDRVKAPAAPDWIPGLPEWVPDEGVGVWET